MVNLVNPYRFGGADGIVDTFDRADGAIGTADNGLTWATYGTSWVVSANVASCGTVGSATQHIATVPLSSADGTLLLTLAGTFDALPNTGLGGITFRASDANNYLRFVYQENVGAFLEKKVAGSFTTITFNLSANYNTGDILKVVLSGSSIMCYRNDVLEFNQTDSFNSTVVNHGLHLGTSSGQIVTPFRLDDFDFIP